MAEYYSRMGPVGWYGRTSTEDAQTILTSADQQPFGWLAQFTATYAAQRLSGMTVITTTYTGVSQALQSPVQWLMF
jgi:hypothetical protein